MVSTRFRVFMLLLPILAGLAAYWTATHLLVARRGDLMARFVAVAGATLAAHVAVLAIKALLFWIGRQEPPDCDVPLADAGRILARTRVVPLVVCAVAVLHALLASCL